MLEKDYYEPAHLMHDWLRNNPNATDDHHKIVSEAEAEIDGYLGHNDVRQDVAERALERLAQLPILDSQIKVLPVKTVYVVQSTPVA